MAAHNTLASAVSPIFLRLVLGATLLWAGLGKVLDSTTVTGEDAARLAVAGIDLVPAEPEQPEPEAPLPATDDNTGGESPGDARLDTDTPSITRASFSQLQTQPAETPELPPAEQPQSNDLAEAVEQAAQGAEEFVEEAIEEVLPTAADFAEDYQIRKLHGITLTLEKAANPAGVADDGQPLEPFWPDWGAGDPVSAILAWAVAATEILAGLALILGFLSRLSGLAACGVMLGAVWLTSIGPFFSAGTLNYGFLPPHDVFDVGAWQGLAWQLALLAMGVAVTFSGSGSLAIDRLLFQSKPRDNDD
ncbi:MAG: DoxX family protein [Planctomycetota bacterium]